MEEDTGKRMREAADNCIKLYEVWSKDQKNSKAREEMMEAVHELRKVAARVEIEVAISERDEMAARPIPIPPHRSSRKRHGGDNDAQDNAGNKADDAPAAPRGHQGGGGRRRSGGGGGGGQQG